jgi:hypothetical protein
MVSVTVAKVVVDVMMVEVEAVQTMKGSFVIVISSIHVRVVSGVPPWKVITSSCADQP